MYTLRNLYPSDISDAHSLSLRCFESPWSLNSLRVDIERNPNSHWLLLESAIAGKKTLSQRIQHWLGTQPKATRLVGISGFWVVRGEAHIMLLAIDPSHQQRRLGELLLIRSLIVGITHGCTFASLEVRVSNRPALRLYEKYGFQIAGLHANYYHSDGEDAYRMKADLLQDDYVAFLSNQLRKIGQSTKWDDQTERGNKP